MTQAQVPALIADYFGGTFYGNPHRHPIIVQAFGPDRGWKKYPTRKRVSITWLRKMRADGYTGIAVTCDGRTADFTVAEVIRHSDRLARQPLLGGTLI